MKLLRSVLAYPEFLLRSVATPVSAAMRRSKEREQTTIIDCGQPFSQFYFSLRSDEDVGGLSEGQQQFTGSSVRFSGKIDTERMEKMMEMPFFGFAHLCPVSFRVHCHALRVRLRTDRPGQPIQMHLIMDGSDLPGLEAFVCSS